jgi:hypothetical protein
MSFLNKGGSTMQKIINDLASEFETLRLSGKKNWFPDAIWQKAVLVAQQFSIAEVCRAIKVHPAYFRKKMALFAPQSEEQPITFLELIPPKPNIITIHVQSSHGHRLSVEGMAVSDFASVLSEFLKGGVPCCK